MEHLLVLLDNSNKIKLSDDTTQVKLDIGLSLTAPNSELWLRRLKNRTVFGFEPSSICQNNIHAGIPWKEEYFCMNPSRIGKTFFLLPYAIDLTEKNIEESVLYVTEGNIGCSSLFKPREKMLAHCNRIKEETIFTVSLSTFFSYFPWEKIPYIEHIKIDAQGNDFRVVKSIGDYLNRIVFITMEIADEGSFYVCDKENSAHTLEQVNNFMNVNGFIPYDSPICSPVNGQIMFRVHSSGGNYTYVNLKYLQEIKTKELDCCHLGL